MKSIFIISVLSILILSGSAAACSSPTDSFASEVLLNKAGINYDLNGIRNSGNVTLKDDAIIYRSHYNPDVAAALAANDQLSIKLQIPAKQVLTKIPVVRVKVVGIGDIASMNVDAAKELGWNVRVSGKAFFGDVSRDSYSLKKGNISISLMPEGRMSLEKTEAQVVINNASTMTDDEKKDIGEALAKIGFAGTGDVLQNAIAETMVIEDEYLAPSIDIDAAVFDFGKAMRNELIWLRDNGVVSDITDEDIEEISNEAKKGTAGYNSRIVFFKGKWVPYSQTGQSLIKSAQDCGGFPLSALPAGNIINSGGAVPGGLKNTQQAQGFEFITGVIVLIWVVKWRKVRR